MTTDGNPAGIRRRRRSDAALNRARLIEAARKVLADDPDASMSAIASAAGLGRGTAHRHFATRDELVKAARRQQLDDADADEPQSVRPAGELAPVRPTALSVADVLTKVPPFAVGDQLVAEAQRLLGVSAAAVYLCDLDGTTLQRMAGAGGFPERLAVPLAVGPEIPREGVEPLRRSIAEVLPGAVVTPMYLRGRATGVLVTLGEAAEALRELAADGAAALALADTYTDAIQAVRRVRPTSAAAELQQQLLPPRLLRLSGARLAGNVLPGYDIGGDWFDYAENRDGAWIGIADTQGEGPLAAGLGAVILGAFRAARHATADPGEVVRAMHEVLREVGRDQAGAHVTIARWNGATTTVSWVTCGEYPPILITAGGALELLGDVLPVVGRRVLPERIEVHERRLLDGERLVMLSDAVLDRPTVDGGTLGLDGVREAMLKAPVSSAAGTLRALEDAVREATEDPLSDDATVVVLVPNAEVDQITAG